MKKILMALISIFLAGCSGSGSSSNEPTIPEIAGIYSVSMEEHQTECDNGTIKQREASYLNLVLTQDGNEIAVSNSFQGAPSQGVYLLQTTPLTGFINEDGSFVLEQELTRRLDSTSQHGMNDFQKVNHKISGFFGGSGWYGVFEYIVVSDYEKTTCISRATFDGSKIGEL